MHLLFCLQLGLLDLLFRGPAFYLTHPRAIGYLCASAGLLHLLAALRPRRRMRALASLLIGVSVAAQVAFYCYYHAPFDDQAALAARLAWADIRPLMIKGSPILLAISLAVGSIEYRWMAKAPLRPRRKLAAMAVVIGLLLGGPLRDGTTEIRTASAATTLVRPIPPRPPTEHRMLPPLVSRRARVPSILYVITESVRADDHCKGTGDPCPTSPELHALLPSRVPLTEMRAGSAYTAISLSILLTGRTQIGSREAINAAPDLFDLARAVRSDEGPVTVHYWSSQSPSFFERTDAPRAVDSFTSADTYLGHVTDDIGEAVTGGLDRRVADECRSRLPSLAPPYVVITHFSGTHAPYFFDESAPTFTPWGRVITWSGMEDLHRAYKNAIVEQDHSVSACVRAFIDAQHGRPYVIVFTSDHGEAFGEHWAIHHGQSFYDEQIHVPAFIAAGGGALAPEEEAALQGAGGAFVTHFDLLPTVLDALGVLDHFALKSDVAALPGRSLLRPAPPAVAPIPVSNCSAMWQCPLNAWGMLAGERKLTAQVWDGGWRCFSGRGGEHEIPLGDCADLVSASRAWFTTKPNGVANE
ncbi:MAG: sulfatase-like hydrolase/transferase [Byssovorax sp.]